MVPAAGIGTARRRLVSRLGWGVVAALVAAAASAWAERLPIRNFTTVEGLAHDRVKRIVRDSRGFLWFCTSDGLSRFDGERFVSYDSEKGTPVPSVNDILEARDGTYWVASGGGGVWRFDFAAGSPSRFTPYPLGDGALTQRVNVLFQDARERIWLGTNGGLFRLERSAAGWTARRVPVEGGEPGERRMQVRAFAEGPAGELWAATSRGLLRYEPDDTSTFYSIAPSARGETLQSLVFDGAGRLWVGYETGVVVMKPRPREARAEPLHITAGAPRSGRGSVTLPEQAGEARRYGPAEGLTTGGALALYGSRSGRIWIGGYSGLSWLEGDRFRHATTRQGLVADPLIAITEDTSGDLWIGSAGGGALRLVEGGFVSYDEADGLEEPRYPSIFEDASGALMVVTLQAWIHRWDGSRFVAVRPNLDPGLFAGTGSMSRADRTGSWWITTGAGLWRFPPVSRLEDLGRVRPVAHYTTAEGLAGNDVRNVFEDSRGDLWIGTVVGTRGPITRWERSTGRMRRYDESDGLPGLNRVDAFAEDRAGQLWVGFTEGGIARHREGRFELFTAREGFPAGPVRALLVDSGGRLWFGTSRGGLWRLDDPAAAQPRPVMQLPATRFEGADLLALTQDRQGRIYVASGKGIYRLDPPTGRVLHLTTADGLPRSEVTSAFCDSSGVLWFGTLHGVCRLVPAPDPLRAAPLTLIGGLRVAGTPQRVSDLGDVAVPDLDLAPDQNRIEIDFLGIAFGMGHSLRYEYRLAGAEHEWLPATAVHSADYARLAPGRYRFEVRAIDADGLRSAVPATVGFRIRRPAWQQPWFLGLLLAAVAAASYGGHRLRLARQLAVEKVRTRIATDLHDDVGSTVSRMALLSGVARRQVEGTHAEAARILDEIGASARELVDTTSDIVWAVDPRRDDMRSLVARVREFGSGLLESRGIAWELIPSPGAETLHLDPGRRRQLYLILKEALHNVVRHAQCRTASVRITLEDKHLRVIVRDDGRGFEVHAAAAGDDDSHGLESMRARALALGGRLEVESSPGQGTTLTLAVPLQQGGA
jgi:ligand-binding sensor domain-containing protein/signal transduction histidine kinase